MRPRYRFWLGHTAPAKYQGLGPRSEVTPNAAPGTIVRPLGLAGAPCSWARWTPACNGVDVCGYEARGFGGASIVARVLVTGSSDGLGRLAAKSLLAAGHDVVVHARKQARTTDVRALVAHGANVIFGDFTDRDAVRRIAVELNTGRPLDAVIHNVNAWTGRAVMPVNVVAPYLLTALLQGPSRLVYLSSGSHYEGRPTLAGVDWRGRRAGSYADSKLFITALAAAVARLRLGVLSNAVDPSLAPTQMGGLGTANRLELGHQMQVWLATSGDPEALATGGYWQHRDRRQPHRAVHDRAFQDRLLQTLAEETGTPLEEAVF